MREVSVAQTEIAFVTQASFEFAIAQWLMVMLTLSLQAEANNQQALQPFLTLAINVLSDVDSDRAEHASSTGVVKF